MDNQLRRYGLVLALLAGLFGLRVATQALQYWMPQSFLPASDAFQGSQLGYPILLVSQLLILALLLRTCVRAGTGASVPRRQVGRGLAWLGGIYMAGSILRIAVGIAVPSAPEWFSAWIPAFFHFVLAAFVLTAAHYHLRYSRPAGRRTEP